MSPPSAADENPSSAAGTQEDADSRWLQTLSEPELDLLISLRELSETQAAHPDLLSHSHRFHLRTLRALGIVLLEHFKGQLKQNSGELHTLALLRDYPDDMHQQVQLVSSGGIDKKRKQLCRLGEESASSGSKKRKTEIE